MINYEWFTIDMVWFPSNFGITVITNTTTASKNCIGLNTTIPVDTFYIIIFTFLPVITTL